MQNTNHLQSLISLSLSLPIINSFHDVVTREKESYTVSIHEEKEEQRAREREKLNGTINNYSCYVNEMDAAHTSPFPFL